MQLSELNSQRLKSFKQGLTILRLDMWLIVLYEFDGPLNIWRKMLERIGDEEPSREISNKEIFIYCAKNIYGDFSHVGPYPNRPLILSHMYAIVSVYRFDKLKHYFPMEYRVKNRYHTSRVDYRRERDKYRLSHYVAMNGNDLKTQYYEEYKHIARKYQWPFIFNSDDSEA